MTWYSRPRMAEPHRERDTNPPGWTITVDGEDVATAIRQPEVNAAVSPVSAVPQVRARLLGIQRATIEAALAGVGDLVVEGRDIGRWSGRRRPSRSTSPRMRPRGPPAAPRRRAAPATESTRESLLARDHIDSGRTVSPLVMAEGAVHIDTTAYSLDEVIDQVVTLVGSVRSDA